MYRYTKLCRSLATFGVQIFQCNDVVSRKANTIKVETSRVSDERRAGVPLAATRLLFGLVMPIYPPSPPSLLPSGFVARFFLNN